MNAAVNATLRDRWSRRAFVRTMIAGAVGATSSRGPGAQAESSLRAEAIAGLRRAVSFFRREVAVHGTYLWQYSEDLAKREGEGIATTTQGWVQPPGTPAVGLAFLEAWEATGDASFLEAARETAAGLLRGQLASGGWTYVIEFSPEHRGRFAYRVDGRATGRNVTTLDDDTTQCAIRFLVRIDRALRFRDESIHEAVRHAVGSLLAAQYPNGAWPQGFEKPPDPAGHPVRRAAIPDAWSRKWPGNTDYRRYYTLNDHALADVVDTLLLTARVYEDAPGPRRELARSCREAARRAGDFILLAQLPEPQPGWAQQYDFEMHPAWARKFEPPAVTGGEARSALETLLAIHRETGDAKYLEPIPRALAYYRRSRLEDGWLARFYELGSNRPLYFTRDYVLTYDAGDVPDHYSFVVPDWTESIERRLVRARSARGRNAGDAGGAAGDENLRATPVEEVRAILAALDARGRWVEEGGLRYHQPRDPEEKVIRTATFNRNVRLLSQYVAAARAVP